MAAKAMWFASRKDGPKNEASHIDSGIYVGDFGDGIEASKTNVRGFKAVINCADRFFYFVKDRKLHFERQSRALCLATKRAQPQSVDTVFDQMPMHDGGATARQEWQRYINKFFALVGPTADIWGQRVLVHCQVGANRSVTVATAHLMSTTWRGLTAEAAYDRVKKRRKQASVHPRYYEQLEQLAVELQSEAA